MNNFKQVWDTSVEEINYPPGLYSSLDKADKDKIDDLQDEIGLLWGKNMGKFRVKMARWVWLWKEQIRELS